MKELAAFGVAMAIAAAAALWFMTKPAVVTIQAAPLQASDDVPTFKRVPTTR